MSSKRTFFWLMFFVIFQTACVHRPVAEEHFKGVSAPIPVTSHVPTKIRYVYVESPSTLSGTTTAPFERSETPSKSVWSDVLKVFWPLLTMMVTGFAFILVLLAEHLILNRQLARRAQLRN